jgi:hypothetical protein
MSTSWSSIDKQPYCDKLHSISLFGPDVWSNFFYAIMVLSSLAMLFIAYTIYAFPNLRVHPSQFVGLFAISLSILLWMQPAILAICPGPGEWFFAATFYMDTSDASLNRAMNTLTYSWLTIYFFLATFPVLVEMCLCWEMI